MIEFYELATLSFPLLAVQHVAECVRGYVSASEAKGKLFGVWHTDIGPLGRILALRGFENTADLMAERRRTLTSCSPFNAGDVVTAIEMDSYAPFPFLPPIETGARGKVYEFRTYKLKPGGLSPTLQGWERAVEPAQDYTRHLVINMYALDGPSRITHIWAFAGVDERFAVRAKAYGEGVWPPKGGPENILEASSSIALPQAFSPLH